MCVCLFVVVVGRAAVRPWEARKWVMTCVPMTAIPFFSVVMLRFIGDFTIKRVG